MRGRQFVEPIRSKAEINRVKDAMKADGNMKMLALFTLGINTAMRISDLLSLRWEDIVNRGKITEKFEYKEGKTGKRRQTVFSPSVRSIMGQLYQNEKGTYVFRSEVDRYSDKERPLTYVSVYRKLNYYIRERAGVDIRVGCHTLRKTFAYHAYKSGYDIYVIQSLLNHSTPAVTKRYISLAQDELDRVYLAVDL